MRKETTTIGMAGLTYKSRLTRASTLPGTETLDTNLGAESERHTVRRWAYVILLFRTHAMDAY